MSTAFTYYGHSTIGVNAEGTMLVIDPFLKPNNPLAPVTQEEIDADFVLITHGHADHIADAAALLKRTNALAIASFEIITWLDNQGAANGHGMNTGGGYQFPFGHVKCTIAHHSSALPDGSNGGNPMGFLVTFKGGKRVYFAGDTALTYDMKLIGDAGGVDVAFLPIGDNFTMGPDDAVVAAQFVGARHVIPIHYNTFPPIVQDGDAFAKTLKEHASIECTVLSPGETFTL